MKKLIAAGVLALAVVAGAQQASLTDACARIGEAIANPAVMSSTVRGLSAGDQLKFIAQVNAAIAKMPGSAETRAAVAVDANRAAVSGAQKGNLASALAEVFATAPLGSLPAINEIFASDLFNRAADPSVTYTDDQFVDMAKKAVEAIAARNAEVDNGSVRTGFAILMFARASNGTPADLTDRLAESLPQDVRNTAKTEWFPAALAQGDDKSYDPMLVDVVLPNEQVVLRLAHAQSMEALLGDLSSNGSDVKYGRQFNPMPYGGDRGGIGAGLNNGLYRVPFTYSRKIIGTKAGTLGSGRKVGRGVTVAKVPTSVQVAVGAKVPEGSVAGKGGVQVMEPSGSVIKVEEGQPIPPGSTVVGGGEGGTTGTIVVPPGTPLAPGGMPTGPGGRPSGPGGQTIIPGSDPEPDPVIPEPDPYLNQ